MIHISKLEPVSSPGAFLGQFWAVMRGEIHMQWRRLGLWLAFGGALSLITLIFFGRSNDTIKAEFIHMHATPETIINLLVFATCLYSNFLLSPLAALMISDRIVRDQKLHMTELQQATPQSAASYVLGKFCGNYIAVLIPTLLGILILGIVIIIMGWPFAVLFSQLFAFLLLFMPVYAALIGLVLLLSTLLPLRAIQIGIPLLWFYSVLSPLHWTTINDTIFNPRGKYIFPVFFPTFFDRNHPTGYTVTDALLNIGALLAVALVSLVILIARQEWQTRQGITK